MSDALSPSPASPAPVPESLGRLALRRFLRHRLALVSIFILLLLTLSTLLAPLSRYSPTQQAPKNKLQPPSAQHWFGTDELGRDIFTRILYGGRISLAVGVTSTLLATLLGTLIGAAAGFSGGWLDNLLMRLTDAFLAFPTLFVLILLGALLREYNLVWLGNSVYVVIFILAILSWMWPARLVRGLVLTLREREFICAARALGAGSTRTVLVHILPNCVGPILVSATLETAYAIITESGLSYLGFGVQPPTPSWGNILASGQTHVFFAPWLGIFPGLMIFIAVMCINFIGDGLRDALDPHSIYTASR